MEDSVRNHKFYVDGAIVAAEVPFLRCIVYHFYLRPHLQIYLHLYDKRPADSDEDDANIDPSVSATERRKIRNKLRKAKKKAENEKVQLEALEKTKLQPKIKKDDDEPAATQKEDLIPEKLVKVSLQSQSVLY